MRRTATSRSPLLATLAGTASAVLATGLLIGPAGPVAAIGGATGGAIGMVSAVSADPADRKRSVDRQVDQLHDQLEDTSADLAAAYLELRQTQARLPGARQALTTATARAAAADRHHDEVAAQLAVAKAAQARAAKQLAETAEAARLATDQVGNLAADAYTSAGLTGLTIVLDPQGPRDLADRLSLMDTVSSLRRAALRDLQSRQAEGRAQQAYLVAAREQVAGLEREAADTLAAAQQARTAAAAAKSRLDALAARQQAQAAAIERRKAAEAARLRSLQAESDKLARDLAARAAAARRVAARDRRPSAPAGAGVLAYPVNAPISSEFGLRYHPILHYYRLHAGMDFAAGCGTPVHAAAAGRVVSAGWSGGYGNRIVVDHGLIGGAGVATTYNHLTRILRSGGTVARGQLIALSGTTGLSTGCHLHFEVRRNGTPVNPRSYL